MTLYRVFGITGLFIFYFVRNSHVIFTQWFHTWMEISNVLIFFHTFIQQKLKKINFDSRLGAVRKRRLSCSVW